MHTEENVTVAEELTPSQEDWPQSCYSTRQISRQTGLSQSSVVCIIHCSLDLKCVKRCHAQELSEANAMHAFIMPDLWSPKTMTSFQLTTQSTNAAMNRYQTKVYDVNDPRQQLIDLWSEMKQHY